MEKITNITAWIRSIKPGEVKSAILPCEKSHTLNCLASRFNRGWGRKRELFVHNHYCNFYEVAVIVCETLEEYYINNKSGNEHEWKKKIPKDYR